MYFNYCSWDELDSQVFNNWRCTSYTSYTFSLKGCLFKQLHSEYSIIASDWTLTLAKPGSEFHMTPLTIQQLFTLWSISTFFHRSSTRKIMIRTYIVYRYLTPKNIYNFLSYSSFTLQTEGHYLYFSKDTLNHLHTNITSGHILFWCYIQVQTGDTCFLVVIISSSLQASTLTFFRSTCVAKLNHVGAHKEI